MMKGRRPTSWSLKHPGDVVFLGLGTAVGIGNILTVPHAALYSGGLDLIFVHLISVLLLGFPLLLAEMIWARWLVRPYPQAFRAVGEGPSALFVITALAIFLIAPSYAVEVGRLMLSGLSKGFPQILDFASAGPGQAYLLRLLAAVAVIGLATIMVCGGPAILARFAKYLVLSALVIWTGLSAWTFLQWGGSGLRHLSLEFRYWPPRDVLIQICTHSLFTLSAGMGVIYTAVGYASEYPLVPELGGKVFWGKPKALVRTASLILLGDFWASLCGLVLVSPFAGTNGVGISSETLMFKWLPELWRPAENGMLFVALHFVALTFAGVASFASLVDWATFQFERELKWSRNRALFHASGIAIALSVLAAFPRAREFLADAGAGVALPCAALALVYAVGWKMPTSVARVVFGRGLLLDAQFLLWKFLIRWVVPTFLVYLLTRRILTF
jgi:NSS family neurotransmitter:Na+ symporter